MFVYNRFLGSLINKLTWFVLIAIIGLICFFGGLWVANAETCTSKDISSPSVTFYTADNSYIGDYYSHDKIRDVVPTLLNQNPSFVSYYGNYTLYNFYQRFNYAVTQQDNEYFRIFYQDIDYLESVSCAMVDNKFYIGSFYTSDNYYFNMNIPYSFYVDIHFNLEDNSIIIDNISTLSNSFNSYVFVNRKWSSKPSWSSWDFTIPLIDSYNGLQLLNNIQTSVYQLYIESLNSYFSGRFSSAYIINSNKNNINEITLAYSGSEVTEDTPEVDPENPGGVDYSGVLGEIKDELEYSNSVLDNIQDIVDGIGSGLTNFREEVAGGFNDVVNSIGDGIDSIIDWFSETFDSESSFEDWIQDFGQEDNGGISQIITSPLRLIYSLDDNSDCEPLRFSIWNKEVAIPNGCIIWSLASNEVVTTYHVVIYGYLTYRILIELFILIEKLKDPKEREVSTLDL